MAERGMSHSGANLFSLEGVRRLVDAGLDLCFPAVCAACDGELGLGEAGLCWECLRDIRFIEEPFCAWCGQPSSGEITNTAYVCQQCSDDPPCFDRARAVGRFAGSLRFSAMALKYRRALWLVPLLSDLLADVAKRENLVDENSFICAVPLHAKRFRHRGFNQSGVLADGLAKRLNVPHIKALRRVRPTPTQTRLSKSARRANVHGAFEACKPAKIEGKTVLLIDDVKTSGATVSECAYILKQSGASHVNVITLAHG